MFKFMATNIFLISNFRRVLNVVCFLLGDSPASEFYMPTFRSKHSVPKRRHIKFRLRGITQKKAYKYQYFVLQMERENNRSVTNSPDKMK